ncbi:sigma-70 family RNA polymerase sigma factor [Burkholderia sp. Ac-20365]|nr:sigma-70 family RNA polymerase sigma factor [Burkholderia sp. Ac-20365]
MVTRFMRKLPANVDFDDMYQVATMALLESVARYDESLGELEAYATQRINGAMKDELRKTDWAPRGLRAEESKVEAAIQKTQHRLGRKASEREVAQELDQPIQELQSTLADIRRLRVMELDQISDFRSWVDGEEPSLLSTLASAELSPLQFLEERDTRQHIVDIIAELPAREQEVLKSIYEKDEGLRAIADKLDICQSRVCQLRDEAIGYIRARLAERQVLDTQ